MVDESWGERLRKETSDGLADSRIDSRLNTLARRETALRRKMSELMHEHELGLRSSEDTNTHFAEVASDLEGVLEESSSVIQELERRLKAQEEWERAVLDRSYELNKHVTTLSVASIAGVAALSKFFPATPGLTSAVATGLVSFLVAIVTSLLAMAADNAEIVAMGRRGADAEQRHRNVFDTMGRVLRRLAVVFRVAGPTARSTRNGSKTKKVVGRTWITNKSRSEEPILRRGTPQPQGIIGVLCTSDYASPILYIRNPTG